MDVRETKRCRGWGAQEIENKGDKREGEMENKENRPKKKENAYRSTVRLKEGLLEKKKKIDKVRILGAPCSDQRGPECRSGKAAKGIVN